MPHGSCRRVFPLVLGAKRSVTGARTGSRSRCLRGERGGPSRRHPFGATTSLAAQVSIVCRHADQRSSVVGGMAVSPKGGAMIEDTKNAPKGAHTATSFQQAGKINVGFRDGSGGAFFPRRRSGWPTFHPQLSSGRPWPFAQCRYTVMPRT